MCKKYLLVCEGPTDIFVIKKIASKISNVIHSQIDIQEVSPQRDATTGQYPEHGWQAVRQWCRLYGKSLNNELNSFEALAAKRRDWKALLNISGADSLIIQMDTDIVDYITDLKKQYNGFTKRSRKNFAKNAILNWLGESILPEKIYLLLTTYSTETWLLATYERTERVFSNLPENFDFENIDNVIELLCNLGLECYTENGRIKLSKQNYLSYAQRIVNKLRKVRMECEEAEKFCKFLENRND